MQKQNKEEGDFTDFEESLWIKFRSGKERSKIDMDSFQEVYSEEEIEADKRKMAEQEKKFEKTIKKLSELLERILVHQINDLGWFGRDARAVNTSDYDDYFRHSDLVVEWPEESGEITRLALDTSITKEGSVVSRKEEKIMDDLEQKKGIDIKYFQSQINGEKGEVHDLPCAVLAISRESMANLCEEVETSSKEDMERSSLSIDILGEIYDQVEEQIKYLKNNGFTDSEIYRNLNRVEAKISDVIYKESSLRNKEPVKGVSITPTLSA